VGKENLLVIKIYTEKCTYRQFGTALGETLSKAIFMLQRKSEII